MFFLLPTSLFAQNIKVGADIWPPFFMAEDGRYYGIAIEILEEIIAQTGDSIEVVNLPNLRARKAFERGDVDILILDSPTWNSAQENQIALFSETIMKVNEYVYTLNKKEIKIDSFSDLVGKKIHIMRGYHYVLLEDAFLPVPFTIESVNDASLLVHLLAKQRTDAIFMDSINFGYLSAHLAYSPSLFHRGLQLSSSPVAIKLTLKNSKLLLRFNKAIIELKKSGRIDEIVNKYAWQ